MKKAILVFMFIGFCCTTAFSQVVADRLGNSEKVTSMDSAKLKLESTFNISPNPGKSRLNIALASQHANTKLEVFDVLGKRIYAKALTRLKTVINVSQWHAGMYLVKVSSDEGVETKRFVKR